MSRRTLLRRMAEGVAIGLAATATPLGAEPPGGPIRLHMNENAYGPSARVVAALRDSLSLVSHYPDAADDLVHAIAGLHAVRPEQVVVGCGSTDILRMAAAAFVGRGRKLVLASPTFDAIAGFARGAGAEVATVPLDRHYGHDLDGMLARIDAGGGLVYICNPNNPTGTLTPRSDLEAFIRRLPPTTGVVIDEAYHHYAATSSAYASFIERPLEDSRVIVTRTLSTVHGLAGLRLGYAIAAAEPARQLASSRLPMAVNVPAVHAGATALGDREHVSLSVQRNANDRQEFYNQANARMLRVIDSHANFVLLNTGGPAAEAIDHLKKHQVLVGPPVPSMAKYVRVSLGTPAAMLEFWRVWDLMPHRGMHM